MSFNALLFSTLPGLPLVLNARAVSIWAGRGAIMSRCHQRVQSRRRGIHGAPARHNGGVGSKVRLFHRHATSNRSAHLRVFLLPRDRPTVETKRMVSAVHVEQREEGGRLAVVEARGACHRRHPPWFGVPVYADQLASYRRHRSWTKCRRQSFFWWVTLQVTHLFYRACRSVLLCVFCSPQH